MARTPPEKEEAIVYDYVKGGLTVMHITDKYGIGDKVVYRLIRERSLVRETPAVPRKRGDYRGSFYSRWLVKYGKEEADRRREKNRSLCSKRCTGSGNPMYGKPTPQGAGNGWKGWYKGTFFRSLRELFFMIEVLEKSGVQWVNGEKREYRMEYVDPQGQVRTYSPDYIVPGVAMYEIKPKRLWASPLVLAKKKAAEERCKETGMEYILVDQPIDGDKLVEIYKQGNIKWLKKSEERFKAYYRKEIGEASTGP